DQVPSDYVFDEIWSNPPIRIGKEALHALLLTWLPRLAPGGRMVSVVGKNHGGDSRQKWLTGQGRPTTPLASETCLRRLEARRRHRPAHGAARHAPRPGRSRRRGRGR